MPDDLPPDLVATWKELAPHALKARTLTLETVGSFRDLCRVIVRRDKIEAQIDADGLILFGEKGLAKHPLLTDLRTYEQRVEAGRARFLLAPMGKPVLADEPEEVDPFAEFERPMLVKGNTA